MDLVYIVRDGPNEELRYSLRSAAANLPHDRVWAAGGAPRWLADTVGRVTVRQGTSKWENAFANFAAAVEDPRISEEFIFMNDDFFVMRPLKQIPTLHRGRVVDVITNLSTIATGRWVAGMSNTLELLQAYGIGSPLSYELHTPMVMTKTGARATIAAMRAFHRNPIQLRTIYGNLMNLGGVQIDDVKVHGLDDIIDGELLSTGDRAFKRGRVGGLIHRRFRSSSQYER